MFATLKKSFVDLWLLIYPNRCSICEKELIEEEKVLCLFCQESLTRIPNTNHHEELLLQKFTEPLPVSCGQALFEYRKKSTVQKAVHRIKYYNDLELGYKLGQQFGRRLQTHIKTYYFEAIVPVPLHEDKEKKRGYNQSQLIAEGIASILKLPIDGTAIKKVLNNETQTQKGRFDRYENVLQHYEAKSPQQYKKIILVDDVLTTGATMEACAKKLVDAGVEDVMMAPLAMAM